MEEGGDLSHVVAIDTSSGYKENIGVKEDIAEWREYIQTRLQKSFESLPDQKVIPDISAEKYIREHPQSVIFVPEKDLNMFPVLIDEAKKFASKFDEGKKLDGVRDHEFEHLQKAYELGVDVNGIGFFIIKSRDKPVFGGFVAAPNDQEISLRDNLRILLAPKTLSNQNTNDKYKSVVLVTEALIQSRTIEDFENVIMDTVFVMSERYLPKKVHSAIQKAIGKTPL